MDPTDAELYTALVAQLGEAGTVVEDADIGVLRLRGFASQPPGELRLHLTPELLGRALRDLAPDYAGQFPLLKPLEAALIGFFVHVLAAIEDAGTRTTDIELCPPESGFGPLCSFR